MAETTMEPWSFTIVFDEDKAKKNGYEVDTLYDYVGKNVEGLGNERIARGTWRAAKGYDEVDAQTLAISCSIRYVLDTFTVYSSRISKRISPVFHHLGWR